MFASKANFMYVFCCCTISSMLILWETLNVLVIGKILIGLAQIFSILYFWSFAPRFRAGANNFEKQLISTTVIDTYYTH